MKWILPPPPHLQGLSAPGIYSKTSDMLALPMTRSHSSDTSRGIMSLKVGYTEAALRHIY